MIVQNSTNKQELELLIYFFWKWNRNSRWHKSRGFTPSTRWSFPIPARYSVRSFGNIPQTRHLSFLYSFFFCLFDFIFLIKHEKKINTNIFFIFFVILCIFVQRFSFFTPWNSGIVVNNPSIISIRISNYSVVFQLRGKRGDFS